MPRLPKWMRVNLKDAKNITKVDNILNDLKLNTVCKEANCPNRLECFNNKTATFMILGNKCSRNCKFCDVKYGEGQIVDKDEPKKIYEAIEKLGLKHVVITSVTRDDLDDGGAFHFANVVKYIKKNNKDIHIELLIPDLQGNKKALKKILDTKPDVLNHNIETINRLYSKVRPQANYNQSLEVLKNVKEINKNIYTKSGIMVGLGEKESEVIQVFKDLRNVDCDFLTIGQYLQPSKKHYETKKYIKPETFEKYKKEAYKLGFKQVTSGPMVRSSYHASKMLD